MKKVFCDICGEEMDYATMPNFIRGKQEQVTVLSVNHEKINVSLCVKVDEAYDKNGSHTDVCTDCRMSALSMLNKRPKAT